MNFPAPQNLKPFGPADNGTKLDARDLFPSARGSAGRFVATPKDQHAQLTEKTRTWVAQTFFGTLLKQMRDSPFKSDLFSGGQGGQAFSQLFDQNLTQHMTRGAGRKLVDGIVRRIEANAAYRKQGSGPDNAAKTDNRTQERRDGNSNPTRQHAPAALRA